MKTEDYYSFCLSTYKSVYTKAVKALVKDYGGKDISDKMSDELDRESQKTAIRTTMVKALEKYPCIPVADLWSAIYRAHLFRKSGISNLAIINKVISADQSWKKSSGHAFEEMIKELATLSLCGTDIEFVLQRDLNTLIKAGELSNEPRDISWLREQIKGNIFDLFALTNIGDKKFCFGCIQAKTSIRDRVTRDREPSMHAMQSFFWSIIFVLDGNFLHLPKFCNMVNGGSEEFKDNGWHGMYVLSEKEAKGRIYPLNMDFEIIKKHALRAAKQWRENRQWFDMTWIAE